jgi:hypothetical protein
VLCSVAVSVRVELLCVVCSGEADAAVCAGKWWLVVVCGGAEEEACCEVCVLMLMQVRAGGLQLNYRGATVSGC